MAGLSKLTGATAVVVGLAALALLAKSPLVDLPDWGGAGRRGGVAA